MVVRTHPKRFGVYLAPRKLNYPFDIRQTFRYEQICRFATMASKCPFFRCRMVDNMNSFQWVAALIVYDSCFDRLDEDVMCASRKKKRCQRTNGLQNVNHLVFDAQRSRPRAGAGNNRPRRAASRPSRWGARLGVTFLAQGLSRGTSKCQLHRSDGCAPTPVRLDRSSWRSPRADCLALVVVAPNV